jgi:hypothetical protein
MVHQHIKQKKYERQKQHKKVQYSEDMPHALKIRKQDRINTKTVKETHRNESECCSNKEMQTASKVNRKLVKETQR